MIQVIQAFLGETDPIKVTVESPQEIENIEFLQKDKNHPDFHQFSFGPHYRTKENGEVEHTLMVERNGGTLYWVVAYVSGISKEGLEQVLPVWVPNPVQVSEDIPTEE